MKKIFIIIISILFSQISIQAKDFNYTETVEGKKSKVLFSLVKNMDNSINMTIKKDAILNELLCNDDHSIITWKFTDPQKKIYINAERKNNSIIINMMQYGKKKTETIVIDENPWYYPLDFCLGKFAVSGKQEMDFWIIDPAGGAKKMQAIKKCEEVSNIEGANIESVNILIKVKSISALFWKAEAWYRKSDGFLIRYIGRKGGPFNPISTVLPEDTSL
jgi:hypothetical protein